MSVYKWLFIYVFQAFFDEAQSFLPSSGSPRIFALTPLLSEPVRAGRVSSDLQQSRRQSERSKFRSTQSAALKDNRKQFNNLIARCANNQEILKLLQTKPLSKLACAGELSAVNYSTTLHRLARHSVPQHRQERSSSASFNPRASTLTDARFALFLASLAETIILERTNEQEDRRSNFDSRELANMGWALAKLRMAPPHSVLPLTEDFVSNREALITNAKSVRRHVMEYAHLRRGVGVENSSVRSWIPALSRLAGYLIDYLRIRLLDGESLGDDGNRLGHPFRRPFLMQEYANVLWGFCTAGRASAPVCCVIVASMIRRQREALVSLEGDDTSSLLKPQEWSNSIWSMATASMPGTMEAAGNLLEIVAGLLTEYPDFSNRFKPQEWSNTVWGVATLLSSHHKMREDGLTQQEESSALSILRVASRTILKEDNRLLGSMKSQELSNTLWGLATLGFGRPPSALLNNVNNYIILKGEEGEEDAQLANGMVKGILTAASPIIHKFRSQELNNIVWSLARLVDDTSVDPISEILEMICLELQKPRRKLDAQDLGTTLWGMATLKVYSPHLYRGIVGRLTAPMILKAKPQELSNVLWAVATAELPLSDVDAFDTSLLYRVPEAKDHVTRTFGLVARELMRRPDQFKPQEIKDILWSFSRAGVRHPNLFRTTAEFLVGGEAKDARYITGRGFQDFSAQSISNLVWAFARQAQLAEDVPTRQGEMKLGYSTGRLSVYAASYLDVGEALLHKFFNEIAEATLSDFENLTKLKPQDLCLTAWAFAVVGLKHFRFLEMAREEVQRRFRAYSSGEENSWTYFKGQEVANFVWAMGTLNMNPTETLDLLADYLMKSFEKNYGTVSSVAVSRIFLRQELANIAWSCAVFWKFPEQLMRIIYSGLIGLGDNQSPGGLSKAHGDNGLQSQTIMTLIYVQTAMCLEGSTGNLTLPANFPKGWQEISPSRPSDHTTDSIQELKLSTSKIQRAVSAGLNRIGFEHIEEHIITAHDLFHEYAIDVCDSPYEVLSIDIANLQKKIAIEVDGPAHFVNRLGLEYEPAGGYAKLINGKLEFQFRWNGDRQEMNGATVLKRKLLTMLGWRIINVPFWEWYRLDGDVAAEDEYCRKLLDA